MPRPVRLLNAAASEARSVAEWYDEREWGVGDRFLSALQQTLDSIAILPESFEPAQRLYRRATVTGFPYSVYFRELNDEIGVHCVVHNARHPNVWLKRLP